MVVATLEIFWPMMGSHLYDTDTVTVTGSPTSGLEWPATGGNEMQTFAGLATELVPPLRSSLVSA
jgi:hypothetical protein